MKTKQENKELGFKMLTGWGFTAIAASLAAILITMGQIIWMIGLLSLGVAFLALAIKLFAKDEQ